MGVNPYINASIIMQLMTGVVPRLQALSREGEYGRTRINQYTRYLTVPLALLQAYGYLAILHASQRHRHRLRHPEPGHAQPDGHPRGRHRAGDVDRRTDHRARHRQRHQLHHLCRHRRPRAAGRSPSYLPDPNFAGGDRLRDPGHRRGGVRSSTSRRASAASPSNTPAASAAGACTRAAPRSCRCASTRPASSRSSSPSASCSSRRRSRRTSQAPANTPRGRRTIVNQIADGVVNFLSPQGIPYIVFYFLLNHGLHLLLHGVHVQTG